jgi:hypothetical protein
MTQPESAPRPNSEPGPSSRARDLQRRLAVPDVARDRMRVPVARLSQSAGSATKAARSGLDLLRSRAIDVEHRIRRRVRRNGTTAVDRRPDGTPVSTGVELVPVKPPAGRNGIAEQISAPLLSLRDSFREHWKDSIREARLAAREKETEMRAEYERRVAHDPHLHAEQHNRGGRDT